MGAERQGGFTMIEVIVAIVILAIGVLGLGGSTAYIVRQTTLSDLTTERSAAFQAIIDRLQSVPYDSVGSGTDSIGVFQVDWTSVPDGLQSKIVTLVTTGPGLGSAQSPHDQHAVDTFQIRVLKR
jgi:prepilin-type N-terminal cleavage/methylation domain-containing protein